MGDRAASNSVERSAVERAHNTLWAAVRGLRVDRVPRCHLLPPMSRAHFVDLRGQGERMLGGAPAAMRRDHCVAGSCAAKGSLGRHGEWSPALVAQGGLRGVWGVGFDWLTPYFMEICSMGRANRLTGSAQRNSKRGLALTDNEQWATSDSRRAAMRATGQSGRACEEDDERRQSDIAPHRSPDVELTHLRRIDQSQ